MQRILVIVDPASESRLAEQRAAELAGRSGASLQLLACADAVPGSGMLARVRGTAAADQEADGLRGELERRADVLRSSQLEVDCEVLQERAQYEGILKYVRRELPDLVIKESHYHPLVKRTLYSNTDWELIRRIELPLLLVKRALWAEQGNIVAAVDPLHRRDKPAELDHRILDQAGMLAEIMGWQLWALHCWPDAVDDPADDNRGTVEQFDAAHREQLQKLVADRMIGPQHVIAARGRVEIELCDKVADIDANVTVMGAVSRSRLRRWILGNTAEKILDRIESDVLIIKPKGGS